jgi:geranylgeranyl pyrophosphate synthase
MPGAEDFTFSSFFKKSQEDIRSELINRIDDEDMIFALEGGKLLRPSILLLAFRACNTDEKVPYKRALESAIGVELSHCASLIHDDIMDHDSERRGRPSLYIKKGVGNAILVGHKMINMAFRIALDHGLNNAQIFLETWNKTLVGQLKDVTLTNKLEEILNGGDISPTDLMKEYYRIIDLKTASLFAGACRAGAIEARSSKETISHLEEYGKEIGLAYQLADDFVDVVKGKIEEGILMPLLRAWGGKLEKMEELKSKNLKEEFTKQGFDLEEIYREEIKKHIGNAEKLAMDPLLLDSPYKKLMKEAPSYITNEMLKELDLVIQ